MALPARVGGTRRSERCWRPRPQFSRSSSVASFHPTVAGQLEYRNLLVHAMFYRPSSQVQATSAVAQPALTPDEANVQAGAPFSFVANG